MTDLPRGYVAMTQALQRRAAALRQPVNAMFELTARCNLGCEMCHIRQPANDRAHRAAELSAADWVALAREATDNGLIFLLLTGGEVFLRRDFFQIYEPLTRMGLILTLFTNGTRITDRIARRLAEAPPQQTRITLYGASPAMYGAVTGVPGAFEPCCAGIEALLRHGVPLELATTITRRNRGDLEAMRRLARGWGLPLSANWLLMQRRDRAPGGAEGCRLSAEDCAALAATERPAPPAETGTRSAANFACHVGKSSFAVTACGEMLPCLNLDAPAIGLRETGFPAAWARLQAAIDASAPEDPRCQTCTARGACPRCPAWSMTETGCLTGPVPYLCDMMRARATPEPAA